MPVPTNPEASTGAPPASHQPSQKSMTKAERRELQERQRAAKLAQKQVAGGPSPAPAGSTVPSTPGSKSKQPSTPSQRKFPGDIGASGGGSKSIASKDLNTNVAAGMEDSTGGRSQGLRIFSHFGLPKPVGHAIKGDIHPEIVRLGLLFSEFRICGANARCIATLLAFKKVRPLSELMS